MRSLNFDELLHQKHLQFSPNVSQADRDSLITFWNGLRGERQDNISSAEVDEVLDGYLGLGVLERVSESDPGSPAEKAASESDPGSSGKKEISGSGSSAEKGEKRGGPRSVQSVKNTPGGLSVILILEKPKQASIREITGGFVEEDGAYAFEYKQNSRLFSLELLRMDVRYGKLLHWLAKKHASVRLTGDISKEGFEVQKIRAGEGKEEDSLQSVSPDLVRSMVERLRTAQIQPVRTDEPEHAPITRLPELQDYLECMEDTLPDNIRTWAHRTIRLMADDTVGADEQRHALHALSLMLNVQWKNSYFEPVDPVEARRILDEELYGLEEVKQRVIETIIQINRTHTLPFYGLLLVGPAGTGKSQIAYAVAKILKMPWAVLDMSTIRDPSALTGSPRIYTNARTGRIMDAFVRAGSSNIVFVINELDKADHDTNYGNSADTLLTLFDNLGFTDNYMECAIPTNGVYPIATANDRSRISGPLQSRFAVIEIPDYTPDEKKIIFRDYSMPKILRHLGMENEECSLTEGAVDRIVDHFKDMPGCRDLEQAAEHLAAHALFEIESTGEKKVCFGEAQVQKILGM